DFKAFAVSRRSGPGNGRPAPITRPAKRRATHPLMACIIFADNTRRYDGRSLEREPLRGTESSVIRLAQELARRRHEVTVYSNCDAPIEHEGVRWRPIGGAAPAACDLYVAIQHPYLLDLVKRPRRRAIWVLWQANHLKHYKQIWRMW